MVFRRDSKVDAFQRQISALRHQLGGESETFALAPRDHDVEFGDSGPRGDLPDLDRIRMATPYATAHDLERRPVDEALHGNDSPVPAIDMNTSVVSHSTAWNGNLESAGSLHIYGRVEGTLSAKLDIFIAEEAVVDAHLTAANVTIAGSVRGSIQCASRFEVLPRGRVSGDVRAPVVVVHEGGVLTCDISMAAASSGAPSSAAPSTPRSVRSGA